MSIIVRSYIHLHRVPRTYNVLGFGPTGNYEEKGQTINYLHRKTENQYFKSNELGLGE